MRKNIGSKSKREIKYTLEIYAWLWLGKFQSEVLSLELNVLLVK